MKKSAEAPAALEFSLNGVLRLLYSAPSPPSRSGVMVTLQFPGGFSVTARGDDMAYKLPDGMKIDVRVSYVDAQGNPAVVDGDVTWESSDTSIATVTANSADSAKAVVEASGALGQVQISATADADLGEGTRELVTTMDVEVIAGEAVAGTITPVGEPLPIKE